MTKKSQMEIMGLAIIIILISLAMLFAVRFIVLKEQPQLKKSFTQSQLASNTLNVLLKTTTTCKQQKIQDLIQDCANYFPEGSISCNETAKSCTFVNTTIKQIFEATLDQWNKQYYFNTTYTNIEFKRGECTGEKRVSTHPLPTDRGPMIVLLEICG